MDQKSDAENELREMGLKYAEILGHQNHKQKIKHLVDIKKKNFDLHQTNQALESKVRGQSKMIERLKKELATVKKTKSGYSNKENILKGEN